MPEYGGVGGVSASVTRLRKWQLISQEEAARSAGEFVIRVRQGSVHLCEAMSCCCVQRHVAELGVWVG